MTDYDTFTHGNRKKKGREREKMIKSHRKPAKSACVCPFTQINDGVADSDHSSMSVDLLGVLRSFMCVHQVPPPSLHFVFHALTQDRCHVCRAWLLLEAAPPPAAASTNHPPARAPVRWTYRSGGASSCCCTLITENSPLPQSLPRSDRGPRYRPVSKQERVMSTAVHVRVCQAAVA